MNVPDEGKPRRRSRKLHDDERVLWQTVAKSVKPLRRRAVETQPDASSEDLAPSAKAERTRPVSKTVSPAAVPLPKPSSPALEPLGRRERQRIARGRDSIDARIDLHGRTQAEAYDALIGFIRRCHANGARTVLVITGKGRSESHGSRGVLKRQVPMWLGLPELRSCVIGFESAAIGHGGEGALYVRLRRDRSALTP